MIEIGQNEKQVANQLTELFYRISETAQLLSISKKSVRRLLERGLLKSSPALRIKPITPVELKHN